MKDYLVFIFSSFSAIPVKLHDKKIADWYEINRLW